MRLGAAYPSSELGNDPDVIRKFIAGIEALGLRHLMVPDHVLKAPHEDRDPPLQGPYTERDAFPDPFTLLSYMAALSSELELATGVLVLPQRQTAVVAQQAADIDIMSGGRLRLGIGIGWNHVEYAGLGQDFRQRGKRMEEQVDLLRRLWLEPVVTFEGQFDRIDRAGINPRPRRSVPLWLGGNSPQAYRRGAQIGDGFIFAGPTAFIQGALAQVRSHLAEFGRSQGAFGLDLLTQFAQTTEDAANQLRFWRKVGGSHATISTAGKKLGGDVDRHLNFLSETARKAGALEN